MAKAAITNMMSSDRTIDDGNSGIEDALNTIDIWWVLNWVVYHTW